MYWTKETLNAACTNSYITNEHWIQGGHESKKFRQWSFDIDAFQKDLDDLSHRKCMCNAVSSPDVNESSQDYFILR